MFDLDGKIAVLTGGAGILGRRMAAALRDHGATVAIVDRDGAAIERALGELGGARLHPYVADIADASAVAELRQRIEGELGEVGVLVNNAAAKSANFFEAFESFPAADWNEVMAVNVTGAVFCCQQFGGEMARRGSWLDRQHPVGLRHRRARPAHLRRLRI